MVNGDPHGAILNYLEAVEKGGVARAAYHRLGAAFEQSGDLGSALHAYQSAAALFPAVEAWRDDAERVRAMVSGDEPDRGSREGTR